MLYGFYSFLIIMMKNVFVENEQIFIFWNTETTKSYLTNFFSNTVIYCTKSFPAHCPNGKDPSRHQQAFSLFQLKGETLWFPAIKEKAPPKLLNCIVS